MSYKERSIWVSLAITVYIWVNYFSQIYISAADGSLAVEIVKGLLLEVIIMTLTLEIALQIVLAIIDNKDANYADDERDKLITLLGSKYAYYVLSFTAVTAVIHLLFPVLTASLSSNLDLPNEYAVIHIIIFGALLAEVTKFAVQAFYYRKGF